MTFPLVKGKVKYGGTGVAAAPERMPDSSSLDVAAAAHGGEVFNGQAVDVGSPKSPRLTKKQRLAIEQRLMAEHAEQLQNPAAAAEQTAAKGTRQQSAVKQALAAANGEQQLATEQAATNGTRQQSTIKQAATNEIRQQSATEQTAANGIRPPAAVSN